MLDSLLKISFNSAGYCSLHNHAYANMILGKTETDMYVCMYMCVCMCVSRKHEYVRTEKSGIKKYVLRIYTLNNWHVLIAK